MKKLLNYDNRSYTLGLWRSLSRWAVVPEAVKEAENDLGSGGKLDPIAGEEMSLRDIVHIDDLYELSKKQQIDVIQITKSGRYLGSNSVSLGVRCNVIPSKDPPNSDQISLVG